MGVYAEAPTPFNEIELMNEERNDCMSRKPFIAGNWKMHKTVEEAVQFINEVKDKLPSRDVVDAAIGASTLQLTAVKEAAKGSELQVAAQNSHFEDEGAFTGETSPAALEALGLEYVILGHSERREIFGETDEDVNKKVKAVVAHGMNPIVCVGETLEQKEAGETQSVVADQVKAALAGLTADQVADAVLAYEPLWAIGTGKTATAEDANDTIKEVRQTVAEEFGQEAADTIRIQYGGSVKPNNIAEFLAQSDIDGALVGGASLEAESFLALFEAVK